MTKASGKLSDTDNTGRDDDEKRQRKADLDAATLPASGASVSAAFAGASLSAAEDDSESEKALKRAAKNDRGSHE